MQKAQSPLRRNLQQNSLQETYRGLCRCTDPTYVMRSCARTIGSPHLLLDPGTNTLASIIIRVSAALGTITKAKASSIKQHRASIPAALPW